MATPGLGGKNTEAGKYAPTQVQNNQLDSENLYNEILGAYKPQLQGLMGEAAGNSRAAEIAAQSRGIFDDLIAKGVDPGAARKAALQNASGQVDAQFRASGVENPNNQGKNDPAGTNPVESQEVKDARQQYRDGITEGKEVLEGIKKDTTNDPNARDTFKAIVPDQVQNITPAARLAATMQEGTAVEATNTADLQATARGQGAGQQSAAARYRQQMLRDSQTMNAAAAQARGNERAGARLAAIQARGEASVAGNAKIAESDAQTSLAAQGKVADFDAKRKELQATLDDARRNNDADRIQAITTKMADLDRDEQKANADIAAGNADRGVTAGTANNAAALAANVAGGVQDIQQAELRMKAQKAIEDSAKGLLNEDSRQEAIGIARRQIALEEKRLASQISEAERAQASQNRAFWTTTLTSLLALGVGAVTTPAGGAAAAGVAGAIAAAHGGAVTAGRVVHVGEAGRPEVIVPIKGKLSQRLARALEIEAAPFNAEAADDAGEVDTPEALARAIKATLKTFRAKAAKPVDEDDEVSEMAAATLRHRRAREAR